jgi:TonB family protein
VTLSPRQHAILHWLPPGGVSLLLNLLLLHALSLSMLPHGLAVLDSVLSIELVSSNPAQERTAGRPKIAPIPVSQATQPVAAPKPPDSQTANREYDRAQSAERRTTIEPLYRVTQLPGFARRIEPAYPESERALNKQARVLAEITVSDTGEILEIRIAQSGGAAFNAAVIAALKESRFTPALIRDRAVSVRFQVPFQFKLD